MRQGRLSLVALVALVLIGLGAYAGVAATSATTVKTTEKEWGITALPPKVKAGKVTFVVKNIGKLSHEFVVIKTNRAPGKLPVKGATASETGKVGKIAQFKPGQTRTLTLTLKPGHYVLICNLPAHYKAGQHTGFQVG